MTLIAAVLTPDQPPMLLSDVLISSTRVQQGRLAGPGGLMQPPSAGATSSAHSLEQKCIVEERVWAAYCGDVISGKTVLRRLKSELAGHSSPRAKLEELYPELDAYLASNNSSVLISVIDADRTLHCRFAGAGAPLTKELPDGTVLIADGSGREGFVDIISTIIEAQTGAPDPSYHVLAFLSEVSSSESINAAFNDQFGAIVEITSTADSSFQKLPSLTIATEVFQVSEAATSFLGGNYLNYHYIDGVLVYRRFGSIRAEEMTKVFGTDYIAGAIYPPGRRRTTEEEQRLCQQLVANPIFNDSVREVISFNNPVDLRQRKLRIGSPDHGQFKIERVNDQHFAIFRSHTLLAHIAQRFGVSQTTMPGHDRGTQS